MIDGRIKSIPKEIQREYEIRAMVRAEQCGEEFLSHHFEVVFCPRCLAMTVVSAMLTVRESDFTFKEILTRRVCCECGYNLQTTVRVGNRQRK